MVGKPNKITSNNISLIYDFINHSLIILSRGLLGSISEPATTLPNFTNSTLILSLNIP